MKQINKKFRDWFRTVVEPIVRELSSEPFSVPREQICTLRQLDCQRRNVTNEDMTRFSEACAIGALSNLTELYLGGNPIGDDGIKSLVACVKKKGVLQNLAIISLNNTNINDAGIIALAGAFDEGALPNLNRVIVDNRHITQRKLVTACRIRGITII